MLEEYRELFYKEFKLDVKPEGVEVEKKTFEVGYPDGMLADFNLSMKKEIEGVNPK